MNPEAVRRAPPGGLWFLLEIQGSSKFLTLSRYYVANRHLGRDEENRQAENNSITAMLVNSRQHSVLMGRAIVIYLCPGGITK